MILKNLKLFVLTMSCIFLCTTHFFSQFEIPKKPTTQTSLYDYANLLEKDQKIYLEQKLIKYSDSTSTQIVIIIIESLNNEDIGILTPKWAHEWGIGQEKEDNGVLILLSKNDRKIWISPGYGLEHILTAGINGEIIRNRIIPYFKQENYFEGLNSGVDALFELFTDAYKAQPKKEKNNGGIAFIALALAFIVMIIISKRGNNNNDRNGGRRHRSDSLLDALILGSLMNNSRRSSGGWGSSSGGFGGGFGGGGFSGGGAGGNW